MPTSKAHSDRGGEASAARAGRDQPEGHQSKMSDSKKKKELDQELDKALADSFPASDPPAPSQPTGTEPAGDPKSKP